MIINISTDGPAPEGSIYSNYRLVDVTGDVTRLTKGEVDHVMEWDDEEVVIGGKAYFTHLERRNSRTGQWKTVVAWDPKFAVYADESANVKL